MDKTPINLDASCFSPERRLQCFQLMDTETAYNNALDYLYSFVDYSLKKSSELARADFNLDRMRGLMAVLGNPERQYAIIHVAGTKGKGSTSALMASALRAAGYKTGLYTSPHLQDYVERIQIDGSSISHAGLVELVEQVKGAVNRIPLLTTFEITTAMAFLCFAQQKVDAAVIEVGLGGRLDATNVVVPRVSVITSLSYDHMAVLGNTLTLIAGEKAGIIKPGIPVVSAPQVDEARVVLEKISAERRSALTMVGRDVQVETGEHSLDGQNLTVFTPRPVRFHLPLLGAHQAVNAATAYTALRASGLRISEEAIHKGFAEVSWPCRFEVIQREPPVILDSAHNPDSFEKLAGTLEDYFPGKAITLIFGSSEDKDMAGMLNVLKGKVSLVLATQAVHPRATEPEKIIELANRLGVRAETAMPVGAALNRALELAVGSDTIIVSAGSMFVTAEVKTAWQKLNNRS
jgi:dihydrofolate synthase/folylpolyglutamate synthase